MNLFKKLFAAILSLFTPVKTSWQVLKARFAEQYAIALAEFYKSTRGMASASSVGSILIGVSIALIVAAAVLPQAIVDITNTTKYSGAPAVVLTIVPILGIVVIAAIAFMLYKRLVR